MTLALASDYVDFWWLSIGLGFAILGVVVILLSLLVSLVKDIDRNVKELGTVADAVGANTAAIAGLDDVAAAAGRLRANVES